MLDSSAFIEVIDNSAKGREIFLYLQDKTVTIAPLVVYEVLVGLKGKKLSRIKELIEDNFIFCDYTYAVSLKALDLIQRLKKEGKSINQNDIHIAATALVHNEELITCDKDFLQVPGLLVKVF